MTQKRLKLITEANNPYVVNKKNFDIIKEEKTDNNGKVFEVLQLHGPFMAFETKNKNDRIYPEGVLKEAVEEYKTHRIESRGAYGELGHPDDCEILFERSCHLTTDIEWDDKIGVGTAEVLEWIPKGTILKGLIERDCMVGMSTRGLGDIDGEATGNRVRDYTLLAIDAVADPSTPGAFVNGILESKDFVLDESNGSIKELEQSYDKFEEQLKNLPPYKRDEILKNAVKEFFENI